MGKTLRVFLNPEGFMTMDTTIAWLLDPKESPPWVQYRTQRGLLDRSDSDPDVFAIRQDMITHPQVQSLLTELAAWPGTVLSSHKSSTQPFHKLTFIADLGLQVHDPPIRPITERIMAHQSLQGPFQLSMNIPTHFGGTGQDQWAWALCDAPLIIYALVKFGLSADSRVQAAIQHLINLIRENGWPCVVSPELGKFRGPGRKNDPCPYATLVMLKLLAQLPEFRDSHLAQTGVNTLLTLWSQSREQHPYLFYMGADFRKIKALLIWYDLLHVVDVLSQFPLAWRDQRFLDMVDAIKSKANEQGRYTPESVWTAWKTWDFGQKKAPSRWVTFIVLRILKRQ
jgi:hypothetical protein